jgi:hypothetical protein
MIKKSIETEADHGVLEELQRGGMDGRWLRYCGVGGLLVFTTGIPLRKPAVV